MKKNLQKLFFCALGFMILMNAEAQVRSSYPIADAFTHQAYPDSVMAKLGGNKTNLGAYKELLGDTMGVFNTQSFVKFDISNLSSEVVSANFSIRASKYGAARDNDQNIKLRFRQLDNESWDPSTLTWSTRPGNSSGWLGSYRVESSSARRDFELDGDGLVNAINEAVRQGKQTISFRIASFENDTTNQMWIGGKGDGSYAPILEYRTAPNSSAYPIADAFTHQAFPDSVMAKLGGNKTNLGAYKELLGDTMGVFNTQSFVKFDISNLSSEVVSANFSIRASKYGAARDNDQNIKLRFRQVDNESWDPATLTWSTRPGNSSGWLGSYRVESSSARRDFELDGDGLVNAINEAVRQGKQTISFRIASFENDTTNQMWIGGKGDGSYAPILEYRTAPNSSAYPIADAFTHQAYPDSVMAKLGGNKTNLGAYKELLGDTMGVFNTQSFVKFDISNLSSEVVSANFSIRASKYGAARDNDQNIKLRFRQVDNESWDPATLTWSTRPGSSSGWLGSYRVESSSARRDFELDGDGLVNAINEAVRQGKQTISFRIASFENDTTNQMWIGGKGDGSYAPILEYRTAPNSSAYPIADAFTHQAFPDSVMDKLGGNKTNLGAYKELLGDTMGVFNTQSFVKFDISNLSSEVVAANFSIRASKYGAARDNDQNIKLRFRQVDNESWDPSTLTWSTRPGNSSGWLGSYRVESSSARRDFELDGDGLVNAINEAVRQGKQTISFRIASFENDTTNQMWIGGKGDGSYAPILDFSVPDIYNTVTNDTLIVTDDAVVIQSNPDSAVVHNADGDGANADMAIINDYDSLSADKEVLLKFSLNDQFGQPLGKAVGEATLILKADRKADRANTDAPTGENAFRIDVFGITENYEWQEADVTWNTKPADSILSNRLVRYTITESLDHELKDQNLTNFINEALEAGKSEVTFLLRGADETDFRAWISSKVWKPAKLQLNRDVQTKFVLDDSYVVEAHPDSISDGITAMAVALDTTGNSFETYMKFSTTGLSPDLNLANLILRANQDGTKLDEGFEVQIYGANNDWSESTLTWNNRPDVETNALASLTVPNQGGSSDFQLLSDALTDYVRSKVTQGSEVISFAIKGVKHTPQTFIWISDKGWRPAKLESDNRNVVVDPVILPESGFYLDSIEVLITSETPESNIYYTVDGTSPTEASMLYNGSFYLKDSAIVKVIALKDEYVPSQIVEASYQVAPIGAITFNTNPGLTYKNEVRVFLSVDPETSTIRYSTDGSDPVGGIDYNSEDGILINTEGQTVVSAVAIKDINDPDSYVTPVYQATYTVVFPVDGIGSGPGGVGSGTYIADQPLNVLWLSAENIEGANEGQSITQWDDISGNDNHALNRLPGDEDKAVGDAIPNTGENYKDAPLYKSDGLNGKPILDFGQGATSVARGMVIADNDDLDNTPGISIFIVFKKKALSPFSVIISKRDIRSPSEQRSWNLENNGGDAPDELQWIINRDVFVRNELLYNTDTWFITSAQLNPTHDFASIRTNGIIEKLGAYDKVIKNSEANVLLGGFVSMDVAEVVIYKDGLNEAQNVIVENYLAGKYNLPMSIPNSEDVRLYSNTDFTNEIIGIGEALGLDASTIEGHYAASGGGLELTATASNLEVDEYVFAGHDGGSLSAENWDRKWYVQPVGDAEVSMAFNFVSEGFAPPANAADYVLQYDNGNEVVTLDMEPTLDAVNGTLSFTLVPSAGVYQLVNKLSLPAAATPTFSIAEGTYEDPFSVEITSSTPNASIYYTLDGTDPTVESTAYTTALDITEGTVTLKAIAIANGFSESEVSSATYTVSGDVLGFDDLGKALNIYPNPVAERLTIELNSAEMFRVKLTDMAGKELLYKEAQRGIDLDLSGFKPGIYLIQVESDGQESIKRLIKK